MAITTEFPGSSLPSGWTFHSAQSVGSAAVADGQLQITFPAYSGTNYDTITQSSSAAENSIGIRHALGGGDFDIAMQIDTDIGDQKGVSVNMLVYDTTPFARIRWSVFKAGASGGTLESQNGNMPSFYHAARPASGTGNVYNVSTNNGVNELMSGMPAWLRLTYNVTTGVSTAYYSTDGWNWITPTNWTQAFTPSLFKVSVSSVIGSAGGTLKINQVVDVAAYGSTDLREAVPTRMRQTVVTIDGSAGSLPTGFVDDSAGATSGISWTGSALRFSDDPTLDADQAGWARIRYTGTEYTECGLLLRMNNPAGNASCYGTAGLLHDLPDVSQTPVSATAATRVAGTTDKVTVTVPSGHGLSVNQLIIASGFSDSTFNGKWTILETTATTIAWYDNVNPDATTGGGTITPATRSPIDQYVRGGGYGLEIQSGTIRRPIRIDDPTGTNVGASTTSSGTQLDEMPYAHLKNLTDVSMSSGSPVRMFRLERIGRRYRVKEWADQGSLAASLAAEPSTWNHFDGQDEVEVRTLGPAFSLSHNGTKGAPTCSMDIYYLEYYQLVAPATGPTVRVKVSGSWEDSSEVRAKVSGSWETAADVQTKSSGTWS